MSKRDEALEGILRAIKEIQIASARSSDGLNESSKIFDDIDGFDSLNALEVLATVGDASGIEIPSDTLNEGIGGEPLTVGELASRVAVLAERKK